MMINQSLIRRLFSHPGAAVGAIVLLVIVMLALLAPVLTPNTPWKMVGRPFALPGTPGLSLGSDMLGRDLLAGLLHGARLSLLIGLVSALAATILGILVGALAGYFMGWLDDLLMRITEFFQIVPGLLLIMVLVVFIGPSVVSVVLGIAFISWPNVARIVRGEVLSLRTRQFVEASRTFGQHSLSILFTQVLPNTMSPVIVIASVMVASAILTESALSFLGLGDPNVMTWGYMIGAGRPYLRDAWWLSAIPGLAIVLTVLAINLIGDGLSTALNPRQTPRPEVAQ